MPTGFPVDAPQTGHSNQSVSLGKTRNFARAIPDIRRIMPGVGVNQFPSFNIQESQKQRNEHAGLVALAKSIIHISHNAGR